MREVESECVFGVAVGGLTFEEFSDVGLVATRGIVETASGDVGVLLDFELPARQVGERDGSRIGFAGARRDPWCPGHSHIIGIMDNHDGGDVEADINPGDIVPLSPLGSLDGRPLPVVHFVDRKG